MGRKKVTSSDVAAASGVSQATVSMILNRRENVSFSRETVEKVEAVSYTHLTLPTKRIV